MQWYLLFLKLGTQRQSLIVNSHFGSVSFSWVIVYISIDNQIPCGEPNRVFLQKHTRLWIILPCAVVIQLRCCIPFPFLLAEWLGNDFHINFRTALAVIFIGVDDRAEAVCDEPNAVQVVVVTIDFKKNLNNRLGLSRRSMVVCFVTIALRLRSGSSPSHVSSCIDEYLLSVKQFYKNDTGS